MAGAAATQQDHRDNVSHSSSPAALRRRVSMEEDYFYQEVMRSPTAGRASSPPAYSPPLFTLDKHGQLVMIAEDEPLPQYTCDVQLEGVFNMKMEIIDTIKRAPARNWRSIFVQLVGTKLSIYSIKREWGFGFTQKSSVATHADNPPWIRKGTLEKTYTLLHADVGIAADYQKRRHVIRVRAETDQFLLSCIELETFVRWLDALFAAMNIAPAIDERDFPRDQSIPRRARLRYFHGNGPGSDSQRPAPVIHHSAVTPRRRPSQSQTRPSGVAGSSSGLPSSATSTIASFPPTFASSPFLRQQSTPSSSSSPPNARSARQADPLLSVSQPFFSVEPELLTGRISTTSYPNESLSPETGKWRPRHDWTVAHDMVYAKLCYAVLLFRSPRKSNFVIAKGKKWFVDWTTGRMIRVLPPGYFDHEVVGPWQVWNTENRRI